MRRQGVNKRNQRKLLIKKNYEVTNQSQKEYFPNNSSRNNLDITSINKSSKSLNNSPIYKKLNT